MQYVNEFTTKSNFNSTISAAFGSDVCVCVCVALLLLLLCAHMDAGLTDAQIALVTTKENE